MSGTHAALKDTSFANKLREAGATEWLDALGYGQPVFLTDPDDEYNAVRGAAGLMDFSFLYKVELEGPDALDTVNRIVTRDLARVQPGRIAYTAVVNERGMMVDDVTVIAFSPNHVRVTGGTSEVADLLADRASLSHTLRRFRAELGHLCLQGPRSREILALLTGNDVSNEAFPYYTYRKSEIAGVPGQLNRMGYTAELGYEIQVASEDAPRVWDAFFEVGQAHGLRFVGGAAIMILRTEAGMILGDGFDYDDTVSPFECGLAWTVDLDKGHFRGRESLLQLKNNAPNRLVTVRLEGVGEEATFAPLEVAGEQVGRANMAVRSPYVGSTIALARIRSEHAAPGMAIEARVEAGLVGGEVLATPVYDPERRRVRS